VAVLFADSENGGRATLGEGASAIVVVGLAPGKRYRASVDTATCRVEVARSEDPAAMTATAGGFIRTSAEGCGK
jgi:hypothetical protein